MYDSIACPCIKLEYICNVTKKFQFGSQILVLIFNSKIFYQQLKYKITHTLQKKIKLNTLAVKKTNPTQDRSINVLST